MTARSSARAVPGARWLLTFFCVGGVAESLQALTIMWASYHLTHDAAVTGAMGAAAYLPGVVLGLMVRKRADRGNAARRLSVTNWVLLAGSSLLALVWAAEASVGVTVAAFAAVQCSLSFVKTMNKAHAGRFIRQRFAASDAVTLRQRSTSLAQVGGVAGGGAAGLLLGADAVGWCFAAAAVLYLAGLWAVHRAMAPEADAAEREGEAVGVPAAAGTGAGEAAAGKEPEGQAPASPGVLRAILVYSVPSSGALPFISTAAVPLAHAVAPGSGNFYAMLSASGMGGGFLAGMALSSGRMSSNAVLRVALPAGAVLAVGLAVVRWQVVVILLFGVLAAVLTTHIMVMQVLTNQAPPEDRVGRFTVVRNAVAGSAKGGAALLAGWFVDAFGLRAAWLILAAVLAVSGLSWWSVGRNPEMEELAGAR
ncbi:hypothetical protein DMA15_11140 [Streptomyces sp. WAC 01529]|uniref:hypothetical protein n=1 Tax=Streptomyces sp. WAC 01529 TaxID=2203205 RepID=UPI000F7044FC|nr:hypothetical protein [Streptomyces sp. WAC 01529]AZM53081.1 hypothetical protein DMA15_11140 [Streptomyces sp. WAC 01529]